MGQKAFGPSMLRRQDSGTEALQYTILRYTSSNFLLYIYSTSLPTDQSTDARAPTIVVANLYSCLSAAMIAINSAASRLSSRTVE